MRRQGCLLAAEQAAVLAGAEPIDVRPDEGNQFERDWNRPRFVIAAVLQPADVMDGTVVGPDRPRTGREGGVMTHRSRLVHFVIEVDDLDAGIRFWSAALDATEEELPGAAALSTDDYDCPQPRSASSFSSPTMKKTTKERMHLDIKTDDVDAEVARLKALGATMYDHQQERGYDFWVVRDPWDNEFCVLQPEFPDLLARRPPWQAP